MKKRNYKEAAAMVKAMVETGVFNTKLDSTERLIFGGGREKDRWVFEVFAKPLSFFQRRDLSIDADEPGRQIVTIEVRDDSELVEIIWPCT